MISLNHRILVQHRRLRPSPENVGSQSRWSRDSAVSVGSRPSSCVLRVNQTRFWMLGIFTSSTNHRCDDWGTSPLSRSRFKKRGGGPSPAVLRPGRTYSGPRKGEADSWVRIFLLGLKLIWGSVFRVEGWVVRILGPLRQQHAGGIRSLLVMPKRKWFFFFFFGKKPMRLYPIHLQNSAAQMFRKLASGLFRFAGFRSMIFGAAAGGLLLLCFLCFHWLIGLG